MTRSGENAGPVNKLDPGTTNRGRVWLAVEFISLFFGVPVFLTLDLLPIYPFPVLWLAAFLCWLWLRRDGTFDRRILWRIGPGREALKGILIKFLAAAALLSAYVVFFEPESLFRFPRQRPGLWALVMILYPMLSVYPQGLIHRAFLFQRYEKLFAGKTLTVVASAVAFSFMHLVLKNPLAMILTFVGGILFARTYTRTGSLVVSGLEHALYGDLLFTIGLGHYFYMGAVR
jgi:membrane protease YdiL (CAAX protease family)